MVDILSINGQLMQALAVRNAQYQGTSEAILDELLELDQVWRNGDESTPLIAKTLSRDPWENPTNLTLLSFQESASSHAEIFITDIHGGTVSTTNLLSDYYQADEGWWQAAYNNGDGAIYISEPEYDESIDATAILIAMPIRTQAGIVGILRSTVIIDSIFPVLSDFSFGDSGRVMLFTNDGTLIADPNGSAEDSLTPEYATAIAQSTSAVLQGQSATGVNTLFGSSTVQPIATSSEDDGAIQQAIQDLGWFVVARQSVSEATGELIQSNLLSILITAIAAIVGVLLARLLLRPTLRQVTYMKPVLDAVRTGDYSARAEVITGDELGEMAESLNTMLDETTVLIQGEEERNRIQASIMNLLEEVSAVADGDLTVEATVKEDITGSIADSLNFMTENLHDVISQVQHTALSVNSAANEIQVSAEQLAQGSELQASQIVDTSAAVDEMAVSIQQVSENSALSATVGEQARVNAQRGGEAVRDTIEGMNRIRTQVQNTSKRIKRLGEGTQEIDEMLQLIRTITKRTSILALNASIQASRAGEAGRSFMVVAEEVEQLAERSADAAKQIETLVQNIQVETNEAVAAMEATTHEVVVGSQLANEAGNRLNEIETVSERLAELIQGISRAAQQQARGSESIAKSMNDIADVTQQTTTGTRDATESIRSLAAQAEELRNAVSSFKLANAAT